VLFVLCLLPCLLGFDHKVLSDMFGMGLRWCFVCSQTGEFNRHALCTDRYRLQGPYAVVSANDCYAEWRAIVT